MFGTIGFVSNRRFQKYTGQWETLFVFEHIFADRPRYALKVNSMKTGNGIIRISTSSNPVMLSTVGFVSKRCFKKV